MHRIVSLVRTEHEHCSHVCAEVRHFVSRALRPTPPLPVSSSTRS